MSLEGKHAVNSSEAVVWRIAYWTACSAAAGSAGAGAKHDVRISLRNI